MIQQERNYDLIITIVNNGCSEVVMRAAKEAGASGGTVVYARGTGAAEAERFFGITVMPEKEMILILTEHELTQPIMQSISRGAELSAAGLGISFSLPVDDVVGIVRMMRQE